MKARSSLYAAAVCAFTFTTAFSQTPSLQDVAGQLAAPSSGATIYTAKEFLTMDPKKPKAEAVAVKDGKFLAIGSLAEVQAAAGGNAPVDRTFDGKVVTAGFVEQHVHPVLAALTMIAETAKVLDWGSGRTRYLPKQVKLLTDGAIFSQLMMMKDGYTDGHHGAWIMDPPVFGYAFQTYWDAGYQIHVHNNGDAGLDVLLGELEKAMARNPRNDHRTVLVHFGFARPEQVKKWIELGGIISSNPYYVTALAGRYGKMGMTEEWVQNMVPHAEVLKNGGSLSFHSDMPMAPAKPLQLVWAGVTRLTYEGAVAGPQHKVPLDKALEAITINAAHSIQLEKEVGSIEVGKNANLTILDQHPAGVAPEKIKDIAVWGTMLEGRVQPVKAGHQGPDSAIGAGAGIARQEITPADSALHEPHDDPDIDGCCSCAMNRSMAAAMERCGADF